MGSNVQLMQKMNRLKVLNLVRRNQRIARPAIAQQTGLSLSSITNITAYLLEKGLLEECGTEPAERVGHKSTLLRFCTEAAMCSGKRVVRLYEEQSGIKDVTLSEIARLYEQGDPAAEDAVSDCATYLGIGLTNLIMMFRPAMLVLNTGDFAECPMLITEAVEECLGRSCPERTGELRICRVTVGRDEALKGAAFEMCDRLFDLWSAYNPIQ